jgi:hypothetical protein
MPPIRGINALANRMLGQTLEMGNMPGAPIAPGIQMNTPPMFPRPVVPSGIGQPPPPSPIYGAPQNAPYGAPIGAAPIAPMPPPRQVGIPPQLPGQPISTPILGGQEPIPQYGTDFNNPQMVAQNFLRRRLGMY